MATSDNTHQEQAVGVDGSAHSYRSYPHSSTGTLAKFPPSFCGHHVEGPRVHRWRRRRAQGHYLLGLSPDRPLFSVHFHNGTFVPTTHHYWTSNLGGSDRFYFDLHDGPHAHSPVMAMVSGSLWGPLLFKLPPAGDLQEYYQEVTSLNRFKRDRDGNIQCLPFKMNINGVTETFEWRATKVKERRARDWWRRQPAHELVRITNLNPSAGGKRRNRPVGYSSDGGEIVAVLNAELKITFFGTGLIGVFGERWETMVAVTGFTVWLVEHWAYEHAAARSAQINAISQAAQRSFR
ncbi:hypothetical protein GQ607_012072 [Colletotrichum asianum]|uniref:Uncharacterized protein n=1 Tax=Colletotrichum asianum TaxID=702518 RepID=A0A8H3W767_9PEZI|nr:hypothetical protein GQ607_012072 [Colletotrichum asianum]